MHPSLSTPLLGLILILILVSLSGCSVFTKEKIVIQNVPVYSPVVCPSPMNPVPISTRPVRPKAIQDVAGIWWVALSPEDYENLAINTQESIRFIVDQKGMLVYYRECIDRFNEEIETLKAVSPDAD